MAFPAVVRNMEEAVLFFTQEAVESAYQVAHSVRTHWGNVGTLTSPTLMPLIHAEGWITFSTFTFMLMKF